MKSSVITKVVEHDLCIGCGLCVALCPYGVLSMRWNHYGEYNPVEVTSCTRECGLCLRVCPFTNSEENEDTIGRELYGGVSGIHHRSETGYYLASYVGYSEKHRLTSASGGMATWILEALLSEGVIDHVVCVIPTSDSKRLFDFQVFDAQDGVCTGAGSAYYPVEISRVIRQILEVPGRYAITGLPCFLKAIRLAQKQNKKLRERVVITVGLTCGQLKSRHFTDYIASLAGVKEEVMAVCCRRKSSDHPASNSHYTFITADCREQRIFWEEGIAEAWTNRWFTLNACNYCDDVFAECADVTCMDAWLPDYSRDSRGTSLVLVRSPQVQSVIERGEGVCLDHISVDQVVKSQGGVLTVKREHLAYRLNLYCKKGTKIPKKRVEPKSEGNPILRREVFLKEKMRTESREVWSNNAIDAERLQEIMRPYLWQLTAGRQISKIITFSIRILQYIQGKIRGEYHG
ncbi:Coenzyme F420 hydrogenase/dehydrogenase, beta subunit C-terminal domain [Methanosarcina mazei]|uniref:Heterodisulfide reductase subunit A-like protein n=1 Tax=Methanosarcina mazei S-6 TaxID=213585 RepID=A0A0E3RI96_METMZ|nr:Coenzyme F420 hydrogenase/dehydrogenase, beta subunit C-terminal domain [Methanosarcina mazei]AKB65777.1 Heterodisulfide reductase subunit A-like protein [Methanosarcina mazei S-6]